MNTVQAIAELKNGRTVKAEVLPDGGLRFTLLASDEIERIQYLQVSPTETCLPTTQPVRILPRKPVDRDPTAWLRDRFGRLRR